MKVQNRPFIRALLLAGIALPAGFTSIPALAQDAAAAEADSGEIIVTARRREESLIDVPISLTAI